jgi:TatD DNase family protein
MNLIDTHAHLFWESFQEDLGELLERALSSGVTNVINVGVDVKTSQIAVSQIDILNKSGLKAYSSIGIHPEEAHKYSNSSTPHVSIHEDVSRLEDIYLSNTSTPIKSGSKVVGIGECGLDYSPQYIPSPEIKSLQIKLFQAQIELAKRLDLPLLVHIRDDRSKDPENSEAWDKAIEMTQNHFGIYHCYSGLPETTKHLLQTTNFLVSFAGNLTYPKNEWLRDSVKLVPLDRIVLETDCPFLPPQSIRGQRNEPASVLEVARMIAEIKGVSLEEVAEKTTENAKRILKLS